MKFTKLVVFTLIAVVAAIAATTIGFAAMTPAAVAACDNVVVIESDIARQAENTPPTRNWVLYTRNVGSGIFRVGPDTPPSGVGSFETSTPTGTDKATLFNYDHVGTQLADIDKMGYATYQTSAGNPIQLPSINIEVDYNGPSVAGGFTTLVFEPYYNADQGSIVSNTWQTWDAFKGGNAIWWSSRNIPGVCAFDCFVTWNAIVAANPDATILGGFGINQGSGNPALTASTDVLTIGSNGECVTYDFEPYRVATSKEQCKNGGYSSLKRADGSAFKNQGDCIQYVNTGK
ncbi:MAG TPA: hypothetical protein VMS31_15705 [Pyrinomonadaceae bacterium]|nr:hypothetical protein [Pyrinomonadaceae bacterium]